MRRHRSHDPLAAKSAVAAAWHALCELEKGTPAPSCTFIFTVRMSSFFNTERCSRLGAFPHFRDTSEQRVLRSGWYIHREQCGALMMPDDLQVREQLQKQRKLAAKRAEQLGFATP